MPQLPDPDHAFSVTPAVDVERALADADAVIARLQPLVRIPTSAASHDAEAAQHELREHLASAWFRKIDALRAAARNADGLVAAQALLAYFEPAATPVSAVDPADLTTNFSGGAAVDAEPWPPSSPLTADPQVWPWLARAACHQATFLNAMNRSDEALEILVAVQRRFAQTDALPVREWLAVAGLQDARLRAELGATFARVDMVRRCQDLVDKFGGDDWPATRAVAGKLRLLRASLLSQLDYVADALESYDSLHADWRASGDPRLQAIAADALLAKARLLAASGRSDDAMAANATLVSDFPVDVDGGVRRAVAQSQADTVQWLVAHVDEDEDDEDDADEEGDAGEVSDDGRTAGDTPPADVHATRRTSAQDRVIAACDALIAAHRSSTDTPVLVNLNMALRQKARALRARATERDDSTSADADLAEAQALTDGQWASYAGHSDAGVLEQAVRAQLDQLASLDAPQAELAGYIQVLARLGDTTEPALQQPLTRALQLKAWAEQALGQTGDALATLAGLHTRFTQSDDPGVQWAVLVGGLQHARLLLREERQGEALQVLSSLEHVDCGEHQGLRLLVAQAMDMTCDVWAAQASPPRARQGAEEEDSEDAEDSGHGDTPPQRAPLTPAESNHAAAVQALLARFASDADAGVRRVAADACYALAVAQRERLQLDAALASYGLYLQHFETDTAPAILERTASAWLNKAYILMELLDRPADALPVYDAILARFAAATSASMRDTLARASASRLTCLNQLQRAGVAVNYGDQYEDVPLEKRDAIQATISRGIHLADAGKHREAIACYDEVLQAHLESLHPELRRQCLDAMVRKVFSLGRLAQRQEALALSNELIARYGADLSTSTEKDVALAMSYKAVQLDRLDRHDEEMSVYREIIDRWRQSTVPALRVRVANARYALAMTLSDTDLEATLALYKQVMDTCLESPDVALRTEGAKSAVNRAFRLRGAGRHAEAVECAQALLAACGEATDPALATQLTKARIGLVKSYAALGQTADQIATLQTLTALPDSAITPEQRESANAELLVLRPPEAPIVLAARRIGAWFGQRKG
ncbi:MAG: hypothetical protein EOO28_29855 [Comamonadaceae bacterium]|nr:MAG: hypothetical protein EOO28_29855 [Comamonadaceae bacterium]